MTCGSKSYTATQRLEQGRPKGFFKTPDCARKRRLAPAELLRRVAKMA